MKKRNEKQLARILAEVNRAEASWIEAARVELERLEQARTIRNQASGAEPVEASSRFIYGSRPLLTGRGHRALALAQLLSATTVVPKK